MNLIDSNLFKDGTEPWPNQVFNRDYDAYFLLSYPLYQYQDTEQHNPFALMNNVNEYTVYIQTVDGKKNLVHHIPPGEYSFQAYFDKFNATFSEQDRFLIWHGELEKWALVTDAKNKVCVLATDWKTAGQIQLFYSNCLISPHQFLEKTNCQQHQKIFLQNYAPSKIFSIGSELNPIWKKFIVQCHVDNENDKLFYWAQFERLYYAVATLLKKWKGLDMYADQAFMRWYWQNKQWYNSGKNAPVGGFQNFNLKNCEKVANKFLPQNEHLVLKFDGKQSESDELYKASKKGLIDFFGFEIFGNFAKQKTKGGYADFHLSMGLYGHGKKSDLHNQNFSFFYNESSLTDAEVKIFIETLQSFCFIKEIHEVKRPRTFAIYMPDKPLEIENIYNFVPSEAQKTHTAYNVVFDWDRLKK
jgi:hypothetical protein